MRKLLYPLTLGVIGLIAPGFSLGFQESDEQRERKEAVRKDRIQIRKSLRQMERMSRDKIEARMNAVNQAGISGIGNDDAPKPGDEAPDFELMPLKFYDFKIDETPITKENAGALYQPVKLSSFRGKKPVVLIFGSYT